MVVLKPPSTGTGRAGEDSTRRGRSMPHVHRHGAGGAEIVKSQSERLTVEIPCGAWNVGNPFSCVSWAHYILVGQAWPDLLCLLSGIA